MVTWDNENIVWTKDIKRPSFSFRFSQSADRLGISALYPNRTYGHLLDLQSLYNNPLPPAGTRVTLGAMADWTPVEDAPVEGGAPGPTAAAPAAAAPAATAPAVAAPSPPAAVTEWLAFCGSGISDPPDLAAASAGDLGHGAERDAGPRRRQRVVV